MSVADDAPTDRTRVRRKAERGRYDRDTVHAILDAGLVCHVGFAVDGRPWVMPTTYARVGDHLYLHGATGNAALRAIAGGAEACITVTLVDGLVLAKAAMHHSMNYRSVMVFGCGERVDDEHEKRAALHALVEHLVPGRTSDTRPPNDAELRQTLVVRFALDEVSAKVRTGAPVDHEDDRSLAYWAGELPLALVPGEPVGEGDAPDYIRAWTRQRDRLR